MFLFDEAPGGSVLFLVGFTTVCGGRGIGMCVGHVFFGFPVIP